LKPLIVKSLSGLGRNAAQALIAHLREIGVELPPELSDPSAEVGEVMLEVLRDFTHHLFPALAKPEEKPG
jgi:hypothetical protein